MPKVIAHPFSDDRLVPLATKKMMAVTRSKMPATMTANQSTILGRKRARINQIMARPKAIPSPMRRYLIAVTALKVSPRPAFIRSLYFADSSSGRHIAPKPL